MNICANDLIFIKTRGVYEFLLRKRLCWDGFCAPSRASLCIDLQQDQSSMPNILGVAIKSGSNSLFSVDVQRQQRATGLRYAGDMKLQGAGGA
jgi:hypothetical protein